MNGDDTVSNDFVDQDLTELRQQFADAFDRPTDPLAQYDDIFAELPDPFDYFLVRVVKNQDEIDTEGTIEDYQRTYRQWREFMTDTDRHPACPGIHHIKSYIEWRRDVHDNAPSTIKIKFSRLNQAYSHWQHESVFPHPHDYNPFTIAYEEAAFGENSSEPFPELSLAELQEAACHRIRLTAST